MNMVVTNLDQRYFPEFISHINSEGREELRQDIPGMIQQFNSEKYMDDEYSHYSDTISFISESLQYLHGQSFPVKNNLITHFPSDELRKTLDDIIINYVYSVFRDPEHMRLLPRSIGPKNLKIFNKNSNLVLRQNYKDVWTQDYEFRGYNID